MPLNKRGMLVLLVTFILYLLTSDLMLKYTPVSPPRMPKSTNPAFCHQDQEKRVGANKRA